MHTSWADASASVGTKSDFYKQKCCVFTEWKVSKYGLFSGLYLHIFSPKMGKYGPEKTPYLDTFHSVFQVSKC